MDMLKGAFLEPGVITISFIPVHLSAPRIEETTFFEEIFMRATKIETARRMNRSKIKKLHLSMTRPSSVFHAPRVQERSQL